MPTDHPIRVLIVDDEPLARARLRTLLAAIPDLCVAGECAGGRGAIEVLSSPDEVDLVFLDVQMPDASGLEVIRAVGVERMPPTVFVTGHGGFALQAFDAHAVDYLLKPYDTERFATAVDRARRALRQRKGEAAAPHLAALLRTLGASAGARAPERFVVRTGTQYLFVDADEVEWIEADDNHVVLHAGSRSWLLRETLKNLEARFGPATFLRISRSAMVNVSRIHAVQPYSGTEYQLVLRGGKTLISGRHYRQPIRDLLR